MAVGNSWAHPTIPLNDIESDDTMKVMQQIDHIS